MRRILGRILLLLVVAALPAMADSLGMVTSCAESGEVVVNRGVEDNVTPGTHWYIYRSGKPQAELEVVLVDSYASTARVVSGGGVRVGDRISDKVFTSAPKEQKSPIETGKDEEEVASSIPLNQIKDRNPGVRPKEETVESTAARYDKMLAASTQSHKFSGGAAEKRKTTIDPLSVANLFSAYGYHGSNWANYQTVLPTVINEVDTNLANRKLYKNSLLKIDVTWWSDELMTAYSDMLAFREGRTDQDQRIAMRSGLYAQKGMERFLVFNVKMENSGPGVAQVQPFHWHMYLLDDQGNRVKAERYDQILDRTLNPGQKVEGNVYFLKVDAAGRPIAAGKTVRVIFEDVLNEKCEMKFSYSPSVKVRENRY